MLPPESGFELFGINFELGAKLFCRPCLSGSFTWAHQHCFQGVATRDKWQELILVDGVVSCEAAELGQTVIEADES